MGPDNIYADIPARLADELTSILTSNSNIRIERIISQGHKSAEEFWYDQDEHEWVVVLQGQAKIRFEDSSRPVHIGPGDHLLIPKHRKHRVEWTTPGEATVWLAVFFP